MPTRSPVPRAEAPLGAREGEGVEEGERVAGMVCVVVWFAADGGRTPGPGSVVGVAAPVFSAVEERPEWMPEAAAVDCSVPQPCAVAEDFPLTACSLPPLQAAQPAWLSAPPRAADGAPGPEKLPEAPVKQAPAAPDSPPAVTPDAARTAARALPPRILAASCLAPAYPRRALERHEEGTVWLLLRVAPNGVPLEVVVDRSSGSTMLDEAALAAARGWRLDPAQDVDGRAVEGRLRVPIRFHLEAARS